MALMRYTGPYDAVDVKVAGHELGIVERGESIAVPDDLAALTEWPPECWQPVVSDVPKPAPKPAREAK